MYCTYYLLLFLLFTSTIKHGLILLPCLQVLILSFMWFIMLVRLSTQFIFLCFFRCIENFISIFIPVWVFLSISMSLVNYFYVLNCCHYFGHQFMWVFLNSTRSYMLFSLNSFGCLFMPSLNSLTFCNMLRICLVKYASWVSCKVCLMWKVWRSLGVIFSYFSYCLCFHNET